MTKSLWLVSMEFSVLFQTAHLFCVHKLEDIGEICLERFHLTLKHVLLAYEYMNICIYTNITVIPLQYQYHFGLVSNFIHFGFGLTLHISPFTSCIPQNPGFQKLFFQCFLLPPLSPQVYMFGGRGAGGHCS